VPAGSGPGGSGDGNPTDGELARAGAAGDADALDTLLRRHSRRLYALCHRLTAGQDAEDAFQESLLAIARGLSSFDGRSAFSTWAYRVTTNTCFDELRRRRRRPQPAPNDEDRAGGGELSSAPTGDPADRVAARLDVEAALASLPAEFRAAVVLRDVGDLSYAEIATVLDVPVGTVRSRIARGRAALLSLLRPGNPTPPTRRPSS
jgi:RNA polymerase sigma-70 factor (ECF subfamily)